MCEQFPGNYESAVTLRRTWEQKEGGKYLDLDLARGRKVDMGINACRKHSSPEVIRD